MIHYLKIKPALDEDDQQALCETLANMGFNIHWSGTAPSSSDIAFSSNASYNDKKEKEE